MRKFFSTNKKYVGRSLVAAVSLSFVSASLMMSSCKEDSSFLGYEILNPSDTLSSQISDTLTVQLFNEEADSILSNNMSACVVGDATFNEFGTTTSSSIVQFGMNQYTDTFKLDATATDVTAKLTLKRAFVIKPKESFKINVYRAKDLIYDTVAYASNVNPLSLVDYSNKIASQILTTTDSTLSVDLPNVASLLSNNRNIINNKNFVNLFKGLYFEGERVGSNGEICTFNLNASSNITVSYKVKTTVTKVDTVKTIVLYCNPYARMASVNYFKHSVNMNKANDSVFYISGLAGYRVRVAFPNLKVLQGQRIAINKAELILHVDTSARINNTYPPYPSYFSLYHYDSDYQVIRDYNYNQYTFNKENLNFVMNITNHIQQFVSASSTTADLYIQPYYDSNSQLYTQLKLTNKYGKKAKLRILYSRLR